MSDNDLIRRGDALKVACAGMRRYGFGLPGGRVDQMQFAINTLPAVQPTVKPLRYTEPEGETLDQMRDHARQHHLAQAGDMRLVWVNEGDLNMHTIFHAAQPTVSPDVAALVTLLARAKEELQMIRMKDSGAIYDVLLRIELDAALARVKGVM